MKAFPLLALTAVLAAPSLLAAKSVRPPVFNAKKDVAAIRQVEEALATELDIDKVMQHYADDAVVLDLFSPGTFQGKAQIRAGFAPQLSRSNRSAKPRPG
ncbi:MAG: hypothetical protein IPK89_12660 [Sphingomonadales bacterium]|nr:hypothetical protein [Sphingomonadales bacterium]